MDLNRVKSDVENDAKSERHWVDPIAFKRVSQDWITLSDELERVKKENSKALGELETIIINLRKEANEAQAGYLEASFDRDSLKAKNKKLEKVVEAGKKQVSFFGAMNLIEKYGKNPFTYVLLGPESVKQAIEDLDK